MLIAEVFESIQGEGPFAGTPSMFVRTSGCNLRCWFCDTPYTSWNPEGTNYDWEEIATLVAAGSMPHVVLTGGEPMLVAELEPLSKACAALGRVVTVETAGTVFRDMHCDLMCISPKMSNSTPTDDAWQARHEQTRFNPDVIGQLRDAYDCHFKFVIDTKADIGEVSDYVNQLAIESDKVWLMPQATTAEQLAAKVGWVQQLAESSGFRFSSRLHIEEFGNARGK
jgi:7-carboxy-7-deazaguanine synthase